MEALLFVIRYSDIRQRNQESAALINFSSMFRCFFPEVTVSHALL